MGRTDWIYVAVDSSRIARCKWRGSTESTNWYPTESGLFCSDECIGADLAAARLVGFVFVQAMTVPFIAWALKAPSVWFAALVLEMGCLLALFLSLRGFGSRKRIPRDSKRNDAAVNLGLLRGVATGVECPKCDASLDLRKVGADMIYRCDYCGATGTVELINATR